MAKISRSVFTYQFVFGCNENLYKASFKGRLTEEEIVRIFQALHLCMYNNIAEAIYSCLRYSGIPFSDFKSGISVLTHESIIASTKKLLHAGSSRELQWIGNADFYYGIMDYQKWIGCGWDGCCYAVMKTPRRGKDGYRIVGQSFQYRENSGTEQAYFAIRASKRIGRLYNIDSVAGDPVLPAFGRLDLINLMVHLPEICTARQAAAAVMKQPVV